MCACMCACTRDCEYASVMVSHIQVVTNEFSHFIMRISQFTHANLAVVLLDNRGSSNRGSTFEAHIKVSALPRSATSKIDVCIYYPHKALPVGRGLWYLVGLSVCLSVSRKCRVCGIMVAQCTLMLLCTFQAITYHILLIKHGLFGLCIALRPKIPLLQCHFIIYSWYK